MRKIVVGIIPTYNLSNDGNDPYKDISSFVSMYEQMIIDAGAIPVGILDRNIEKYFDICDAYLWPGGICIQRDFYKVFDDVLKSKKPLLGICMGMQAIVTYFNILEDMKTSNLSFEETYQNKKIDNPYLIKLDDDKRINHFHDVKKDELSIKNALHKVNIKENTLMHKIYNFESIMEPSMHGMTINRMPKCLIATSFSEDNVIESIEYKDNSYNILGVQYHPELIKDIKVFNWLVNKAKDNLK